MKDRDLPALDAARAFKKLGCRVELSGSFIGVSRPGGAGTKQHLHKGKHDTIRRATLRAMYRKLGFSPEQFYGALDS